MDQAVKVIEGDLSSYEFYNHFVKKGKPVLLKGAILDWDAHKFWDMDYFKNLESNKRLVVKKADMVEVETEKMKLGEYIRLLEEFENGSSDAVRPPYLHDVGLFHIIPKLIKSVRPGYIKKYLPTFYHKNWWKYVQFFLSVKGHVTPLHFDTLVTHNLFFQIKGKKRFTLIPWDQKDGCYMHKWRWSKIDPNNVDLEKFEKYSKVKPLTVDVEGGDILFMPAGMLHHVESTSFCISFNIDWHSKGSVIKGLFSFFQGAPKQNIVYNYYLFLAIWLKVPEKYIWPHYKSYLSYIS